METREYRTMDKSEWGRGEWHQEPDKMQWADETTGLPCLIVRTSLGHLCGYVGVAEGHPWYGKDYDDMGVRVHGGLTFASFCSPHDDAAYLKFQQSLERSREEAKKYPRGDSARRLKEWGDIQDFDAWRERSEATGICHLPAPGEPERVWWLGFDCAHHGDCSPAMDARIGGMRDGWYKNVNFVKSEIAELAQQIKAAA